MLSEIDKWSQKYMIYRKTAAAFIALLTISIVIFFLTLNSVAISMTCLILIFIAVIGIRVCLGKMDEFKSLYVNTVPMIDPEKEYMDEQSEPMTSEEEIASLMDEFVVDVEQVDTMTETLVEELNFSNSLPDELEVDQDLIDPIVMKELMEEVAQPPLEEGIVTEVTQEVDSMNLEMIEIVESSNEVELEQMESKVAELVEDMQEVSLEEADLEPTESVQSSGDTLDEKQALIIEGVEQVNDDQLTNHQLNLLIETPEQAEKDLEVTEELSLEEQLSQQVIEILQRHQKDTTVVSSKVASGYFTFYVGRRILCRFKLTGRKQYILTQLSEDDVKALGLSYEAPTKSEAFQSRVSLTDLSVLEKLADHIGDLYDRCR